MLTRGYVPRAVVFVFFVCTVGALASCGPDDSTPSWCRGVADPCSLSVYSADRPDGKALHVNSCCGEKSGDGSADKPFLSVGAAVEAAEDGDVVVVGPGVYEESVQINKAVSLVGAGSESCTLSSAGEGATLSINGVSGGSYAGFSLEGTGSLGLLVQGAQGAEVTDLVASGYENDGELLGIGAYIVDSTNVVLSELKVEKNQTFGIAIENSTGQLLSAEVRENGNGESSAGIAITKNSHFTLGNEVSADEAADTAAGDLAKGGGVVEDNTGMGIFVDESTAIIVFLRVAGNQFGGIALKDGVEKDGVISRVQHSEILDSTIYGIGVFGGQASISDNIVDGVTAACDDNCVAHGISATDTEVGSAKVWIERNSVMNCEGTGILADNVDAEAPQARSGDHISIIIQCIVGDNYISEVGTGGVWVQNGSAVEVSDNVVEKAGLAGVSLTTGSWGIVERNVVHSALMGEKYAFELSKTVEMGDGVALSGLQTASSIMFNNNTVESAERVGILFDDCASLAFAHYPAETPEGELKMELEGNEVGDLGGGVDLVAVQENMTFPDEAWGAFKLKGTEETVAVTQQTEYDIATKMTTPPKDTF